MSNADWMAFNVSDYVANTLHLTARQHGGYILLICAAWGNKGVLPGTDAGLMAIAKLSDKEWKQDGDVLRAFLTRRGQVWVHERVEFEWNHSQSLIAAKRKGGKEGARRRWNGRNGGTPNGSGDRSPIGKPSVSRQECQWQNDAQSQIQIQKSSSSEITTDAAREAQRAEDARLARKFRETIQVLTKSKRMA